MKYSNVYIGLHIPKTAGMSLLNLLEKIMPAGSFYQLTCLGKNAVNGVPFIEEMSNTNHIKVLWGHHIDANIISYFPNRQIYLYTFIREPISRLISHFYYHERFHKAQNRKIHTFEEFAALNRNKMCRFIVGRYSDFLSDREVKCLSLHEKAIKILQTFDLVGCVEDFDKYLSLLLKDMGVVFENIDNKLLKKRNITLKKQKKLFASEKNKREIIEILKQENQEDCKLYEYYISKKKNNQNLKNPLVINHKFKKACIKKIRNQELDREARLKSIYEKAANEYQNSGILKKVIALQKDILLGDIKRLKFLIEKEEEFNLSLVDKHKSEGSFYDFKI